MRVGVISGFFFCLHIDFTLSKTVRNNEQHNILCENNQSLCTKAIVPPLLSPPPVNKTKFRTVSLNVNCHNSLTLSRHAISSIMRHFVDYIFSAFTCIDVLRLPYCPFVIRYFRGHICVLLCVCIVKYQKEKKFR